ncbi:MAG: hypothetical protein COU35_01460 [Candidatus Magasanikbacteria bacterium CG10_big_fil_rev_8_21_14_0_10_47_10]|uniref:Uncharacterized protein n=1 Tax=Candidatus Magasanikbacteria bacterium CG10_big_fil_rev_8_21_14_0_10_47_10 TaxID=1974652 RepID=A0A2H0TR59_9BACT|nr:MAG: hypothetical protein COU35_01460 [Candidatus Magasanikbacteria bacterium CG10_big_fil_rev_8_21_14_0_10_47_10]
MALVKAVCMACNALVWKRGDSKDGKVYHGIADEPCELCQHRFARARGEEAVHLELVRRVASIVMHCMCCDRVMWRLDELGGSAVVHGVCGTLCPACEDEQFQNRSVQHSRRQRRAGRG